MRKFFTVIARTIAAIFAIFLVITTILAVLLTTLNRRIFDSCVYKNALVENDIYARLPEIIGVGLTTSTAGSLCGQSQLACIIDGASPELQACLIAALGPDANNAIGSGKRSPTDAEQNLAQDCIDRYGTPQSGDAQPGSGEGGMPPYLQALTAADWQAIITILLPPADLKTMTENTLDQVFDYLNGKTDKVTVSLIALKERLAGPSGKDLIIQMINSQPPCSVDQLAQIISGSSDSGPIFCIPTQTLLSSLVTQIQDQLKSVIPQIPDRVTILKPNTAGTPSPGSGPFGEDPITTLHTIRVIMLLSPLLALVFLLLVTLFAVRSLKSWMRWWGIPLFISGMIILGLWIAIIPLLHLVWNLYLVSRIPPVFPGDVAGIGLGFLRSIVRSISGGILFPAIILFAGGLAAWIGSYFIKIKNPLEEPPSTPVPSQGSLP